MKSKLRIYVFVLALFTYLHGCNAVDNESILREINPIINLSLNLVIPEELEESIPNEEWIKAKKGKHWDIEGQKEVDIHLYIDITQKSVEHADVYAYLEYKGNLYNIGIVGAFGLEDISITPVDRTSDDFGWIGITGGMGATYVQMIIISYNKEQDVWMKSAELGSPDMMDLDNDGSKEFVVTSRGSLPSYVQIYRWNNSQFEMVDVAEDTGNEYAQLINQEGQFLIEMGGSLDNIDPNDARFYKYDKGSLVEVAER